MTEVCKFEFRKGIGKDVIEKQIALAFITAECTFSQAKVRLNAAYLVVGNKAVIDVTSPVGEYIAEVFTGLMTKKFGEKSFAVKRIREESHLKPR